jgi:hypothetical protein
MSRKTSSISPDLHLKKKIDKEKKGGKKGGKKAD